MLPFVLEHIAKQQKTFFTVLKCLLGYKAHKWVGKRERPKCKPKYIDLQRLQSCVFLKYVLLGLTDTSD